MDLRKKSQNWVFGNRTVVAEGRLKSRAGEGKAVSLPYKWIGLQKTTGKEWGPVGKKSSGGQIEGRKVQATR